MWCASRRIGEVQFDSDVFGALGVADIRYACPDVSHLRLRGVGLSRPQVLGNLQGRLRCRIELRQIGSRDKAKMVGGIGICGLPLCCSTFLHSFDGISISRAKNQMLSLNIPKISGHCGKLICCLLYEDEQYSELKKDFPAVGERFTIDGLSYRIGSYNVLSRMVRVESSEDVKFLPLEDVKKYMRSKDKK